MANQYYGSLKHHLEARYKLHIVDILIMFKKNNLNYQDVAEKYNFHVSSIKRLIYKYGCTLNTQAPSLVRKNSKSKSFIERFKHQDLNLDNVLSRAWICHA